MCLIQMWHFKELSEDLDLLWERGEEKHYRETENLITTWCLGAVTLTFSHSHLMNVIVFSCLSDLFFFTLPHNVFLLNQK